MTTSVVAVQARTPYREMTALFRQHRVSGFPVVDDDGRVTGVVSETDLLAMAAADPDQGAHPASRRLAAAPQATHDGRGHRGRPDDPSGRDDRPGRARENRGPPDAARSSSSGSPSSIATATWSASSARSDVLSVFRRTDEDIHREVTQDVIADGFFTDPARFTVTVHDGIVTLEGAPGSAVLGSSIADAGPAPRRRDRRPRPLHLPGRGRGLRDFSPGRYRRNALAAPDGARIMMAVGDPRTPRRVRRI